MELLEQLLNWSEVIAIILAAGGLAFVSLMEAALVSANRIRIRQLAEEGHPTAPLVERLTDNPHELLGGLVIMINVFILLIANLTTALVSRTLGPGAIVWVNLLVLVALLVFSEITPKTISVYYAEPIALRTARLATVINYVLSPILWIVNGLGFTLLRLLTALRILPGRIHAVPTAFSEEDIKQLLTAGEQSGEVETSEREMIHGVIEFADTAVSEIMVPRTDLVALAKDVGIEEAIETFLTSGHSRIPIYDDNVDNIVGMLFIKDILVQLKATEATGKPVVLTDLLRPAYFVPESKKCDDLLREMQSRQVHLAIVVDEYGGTAGLATIEDLLEEIVGDIIDEYDQERQEVETLPDGTAIVDGRTSLDKIHEAFDIEIPDTDAETISGLITEMIDRIPQVGDHAVVGDVQFTVIEVVHNRAGKLKAVVFDDGAHRK
jgi:CBS domain containing-hemolysin-like protein